MKVTIIPFVIGAFGTETKGLLKGLEDLEVGGRVETIQTTALLKTARILRRVLETWRDLLSLNLQWKPPAYADVKKNTIMEFGIEKCAMLIMKSDKRHVTDGMELPYHDRIRTLEENETYKYLGILEADTIKQVQMKGKIQKEYLRRTRKLLETKLSSRNLIKGIITWAVTLVRYPGPFLKWTREELRQMDQRTRKLKNHA